MKVKKIILIVCFASVFLFVTSNFPAWKTDDPVEPACLETAKSFNTDVRYIHFYQRGFPFPSFKSYLLVICDHNYIAPKHWFGFGINAVFWLLVATFISFKFPERLYRLRWLIPTVISSVFISLLGYIFILLSYD